MKSSPVLILAGIVAVVVIAGIIVSTQDLTSYPSANQDTSESVSTSTSGSQTGDTSMEDSFDSMETSDDPIPVDVPVDSAMPLPTAGDVDEMVVEDPINDEPAANEPMEHTVVMSGNSYSPSDLTINSGDTVTFVAEDDGPYWPATDLHPTHTVYPGSDINKCFSGEADEVFDACRNMGTDDTYSFIFTEVGSWDYHDHRKPSITGTITVQ